MPEEAKSFSNHQQPITNNRSSITVSVVIPAYNEEKLISAAIASVFRSNSPLVGEGRVKTDGANVEHRTSNSDHRTGSEAVGVEVVVVDNASTDRTAEIARRAGARVVNESKRQISRARNTGARAAQGQYLIFLDADSEMHPDHLQRVVDLLNGECRSHSPKGDRDQDDRRCGERVPQSPVIGGGALISMEAAWDYRAVVGLWNLISRLCRLAAGSFLFCTRESFERVGGFDELLYASEELAFSKALKRLGREQGKRFVILSDLPVKTSNRKIIDHSRWKVYRGLLGLAFRGKGGLRDRAACYFWYPETRR